MAIDLDKLSEDFESALESARALAEERGHSLITPPHMLYVLLDRESALAAMIEKAGVAPAPLLDALATRLNKGEGAGRLDPGKRPTASRAVRELIEKAFTAMDADGAERAEPVHFLQAALEHADSGLRDELRRAGLTTAAMTKASSTRAATSEAL